jgi:hypothetical protein
MPGRLDIAGRSALSATNASRHPQQSVGSGCIRVSSPLRIALQRPRFGLGSQQKRIRNKGAGGNAGLLMAFVTCAIIDLVAFALFFGLCLFVCP